VVAEERRGDLVHFRREVVGVELDSVFLLVVEVALQPGGVGQEQVYQGPTVDLQCWGTATRLRLAWVHLMLQVFDDAVPQQAHRSILQRRGVWVVAARHDHLDVKVDLSRS
jgi:hypothetical protein